MTDLTRELDVARTLAREAGALILRVYATAFTVDDKGGGDPVTEADRLANAHICAGLREAFPDDGIVAEESVPEPGARARARCWFIDPLDGTREFVRKNGEFAVQIGLAIDGEARVGVVHRPVGGKLYAAIVDEGCLLEHEGTSRLLRVSDHVEPASWRIVVSRSNKARRTAGALERLGATQIREVGSVGVKAGLIAEGEADVYVHFSPRSSRWDSCAPEVVARAAGGRFTDLHGVPYRYDGSEIWNLRGLLCTNAGSFDRVREVTHALGAEPFEKP